MPLFRKDLPWPHGLLFASVNQSTVNPMADSLLVDRPPIKPRHYALIYLNRRGRETGRMEFMSMLGRRAILGQFAIAESQLERQSIMLCRGRATTTDDPFPKSDSSDNWDVLWHYWKRQP